MLKTIVRNPLLGLVAILMLAVPVQAETIDNVMKRLEPYAVKAMGEWEVPGMAMVVVKGEKVVYAKGFGTKRVGTNRPVNPDTIFQVGSTTKAFTVALMATLVDKGELGWDDRVVDHFPGFMMFDPWVTREFRIHDLFAQHSGMPFYAGDLQSFIGFDRDHIIHSMRYIKPSYSFRDKFSYVNNLFVAGAKVQELKTGKTWEELMQERILTPLKMTNSSLDEAGLTNAKNSATLHLLKDGKAFPIKPGSMLSYWPYVYGPAGGLNSSAKDMAKWITAQMRGGKLGKTRIFSEESATYMHTPQTPVNIGKFHGSYAQGWMKTELDGTDVIWHNGGTTGICAFVGFSPKYDTAFVLLTNLGHHKMADAMGHQFFDLLSGNTKADWNAEFRTLAEEGKKQAQTAEKQDVPDLPGLALKEYAGTYHSPIFGDMVVTAGKKELTMAFGATGQIKLAAPHKTMHTFVGDWAVMDPDDPACHFDFTVNSAGRPTAVTIREFNYDGSMNFIRQ